MAREQGVLIIGLLPLTRRHVASGELVTGRVKALRDRCGTALVNGTPIGVILLRSCHSITTLRGALSWYPPSVFWADANHSTLGRESRASNCLMRTAPSPPFLPP